MTEQGIHRAEAALEGAASGPDPTYDGRDMTSALLNILEDFSVERAQMHATQRAILNIMDDFGAERTRLEMTQRAVLNILDDFHEERGLFQESQRASLNIMEDFLAERLNLERTQKAVLNILDDFDDERGKVEAANFLLQREVEERTQAERALIEQGQILARSNAELEQFAYIASHDLQAPLRTISSFVEIVGETVMPAADVNMARQFGYIVEGVTRMQELIRALLEYSRVGREMNPFRQVSSSALCVDVLRDMHTPITEGRAKVELADLPMVYGDYTSLRQLFQNLIANAIKFKGAADPLVRLSARRCEAGWEFRVEDNGIGIEPAMVRRLFVIFQRLHTRADYPGTGIGLAVCKKIVEMHGGRIWIESKGAGQGTAFLFTLPYQQETQPK